jgi:hypothetical protein
MAAQVMRERILDFVFIVSGLLGRRGAAAEQCSRRTEDPSGPKKTEN